MKTALEIVLPFDGFYDSLWSSGIDSEAEQTAENYAEQERELYAPEIALDECELSEIIFECMNYRKAYLAVARGYVDALGAVIDDELGFNPRFQFHEMSSPRFYNFETDRIFAMIPRDAVAKLVRIVRSDRYATLAKWIDERHSSRSGFHSFYSNELARWLAKPVSQWDCNEITTLLLAAVDVATAKGRGKRGVEELLRWESYDRFCDGDGFCHEFDAGLDWNRMQELMNERRTAKADEHPGVPLEPRCEYTGNLFTAR